MTPSSSLRFTGSRVLAHPCLVWISDRKSTHRCFCIGSYSPQLVAGELTEAGRAGVSKACVPGCELSVSQYPTALLWPCPQLIDGAAYLQEAGKLGQTHPFCCKGKTQTQIQDCTLPGSEAVSQKIHRYLRRYTEENPIIIIITIIWHYTHDTVITVIL